MSYSDITWESQCNSGCEHFKVFYHAAQNIGIAIGTNKKKTIAALGFH